jgi:hypothetical protein
MLFAIISTCLALAAINAYVSYRVAKSTYFTRLQKAVQWLIVWLLPLVGPSVVYVFTREPSPKPRDRNFTPNSSGEIDASSFGDRIGMD